MLWKCCTQYTSKFGKLSSGHRTGKGQLSLQSQRRAMPKNVQTTSQLHSFHKLVSKVMLKILQARLQQCVNKELPVVQVGFRKDRGMKDQIANICWIMENQGNSRKTSASASLMILKPLTVWITRNCGKFLDIWEYLTILPASWETCIQVKKQHLELDMEQQTGSKSRNEYIKAVDCHPAYLTYMWSASCEMQPGWSSSWNQVCQRNNQ